MDSAQPAQMIAWLDEEQRRGKAQIAELRDMMQKQTIELVDQRKRYEDLLGRFMRLQSDVSRMYQVDQAIQQIRNEMANVLHDMREELRRGDQQTLQARHLEREADAKAQLELGQRVERLMTLTDRLATLTSEQQRQNELLTGLRQRLDNVDKELARRSEQDRLTEDLHKREAGRLDALQQAIDGVRTQTESYSARFQYLERWAQNSAQRTADLQTFRTDMQRIQNELQEAQRRNEQRLEKQVREWDTITEAMQRDHEGHANQLRMFAEQHERTKKTLASIQDLTKELRLAQNEARQILDLGLEKQRRELREWQGENEKRWTRYLSQWEYRWSEQSKMDDAQTGRIEDLEAAKPIIEQQVQALRTLLSEEAAAAKAATIELWRFQIEAVQRQMDAVKATADKLHARLGQ